MRRQRPNRLASRMKWMGLAVNGRRLANQLDGKSRMNTWKCSREPSSMCSSLTVQVSSLPVSIFISCASFAVVASETVEEVSTSLHRVEKLLILRTCNHFDETFSQHNQFFSKKKLTVPPHLLLPLLLLSCAMITNSIFWLKRAQRAAGQFWQRDKIGWSMQGREICWRCWKWTKTR